ITVGVSPEKPWSNWSSWSRPPRQEDERLWVWTPPPGMPIPYWSAAINRLNHANYASALTGAAGPIPLGRLVMLACNPLAVGWLPHLKPIRAVYDCCDEFTSFPLPSKRPEVVRAMERELMAACDVTVFSSATTLRAKLSPRLVLPGRKQAKTGEMRTPQGLPRKVALIRNGCQAQHFGMADPASSPIPADLQPILAKGPVLLYFGAIGPWFDVDRVKELCKARPSWQVVLIGPRLRSLSALSGITNCHILGKKPYAELPNYVAHAKAAILPTLRTPQQDAADHVKVYEYLAGGLGVMANPLTELQFFRSFVKRGATLEEWITGLEQLLEAPVDARFARQRFAAHHTWESRVEWYKRVLLHREKADIDALKQAQLEEEERLLEQLRQNAARAAQASGNDDATPPMPFPTVESMGSDETPTEAADEGVLLEFATSRHTPPPGKLPSLPPSGGDGTAT
ncbi:MAG: hypothetical protein ABI743_14970, partial [bacterium]